MDSRGALATALDPDRLARSVVLGTHALTVRAGRRTLLSDVACELRAGEVLGVIGPSGVGKSTFLRCLNRMTDLLPGLEVSGEVRFRGRSIFARDVDPDDLRRRIGILFQQPVVFPGSIRDNVLFGLRHHRRLARSERRQRAEVALREAALWEEVADRLEAPASTLSVGQQQRLCLARALAVDPEVLLMDEPTSALDGRSTEAIEARIRALKTRRAIVLVTHNLGQARRLADSVACFCFRDGAGQLLETACCDEAFELASCRQAVAGLEEEGR